MASHLGMSLGEYRRSHTSREHKLWLAWLDKEWNTPNRTDHYLMQIAAEIIRVNVKEPDSVGMETFKLKFVKPKPAVRWTPEQEAAISKMFWIGLSPIPPTIVTVPRQKDKGS